MPAEHDPHLGQQARRINGEGSGWFERRAVQRMAHRRASTGERKASE